MMDLALTQEHFKYTPLQLFANDFAVCEHLELKLRADFALPQELVILPILTAKLQYPQYFQDFKSHALQELNQEHQKHGLFILVPKGLCIDYPLWMEMIPSDEVSSNIYLHNIIVLEEGASCSLVESYQEQAANINHITQVFLQSDASLTHYWLQRQSKQLTYFGNVVVEQAANSNFMGHLLNLGAASARADTLVNFRGKNAVCTLNGLYAAGSAQHLDSHVVVNHLSPECRSYQNYYGVVGADGTVVFDGGIYVAKFAHNTEARQINKNLTLDTSAKVYTKPQLAIYNNDVSCSHGATIGQLDDEAAFYLASRGIDAKTARDYLLLAFIAENINMISDKMLRDLFSQEFSAAAEVL
jgi:Fe-S cluster assembly protein SufD